MDGLPDAERRNERDLALEARLIAEADFEAEPELLIGSAEVKAWVDSLGAANPLPVPTAFIRPR